MKRSIAAAGALALAMAMAMASSMATAAPAAVVTDLNVRAGPGTQYPAVTVFRRGSRVNVIGCTRGVSWCDVSGRGVRGWVSARYLDFQRGRDRVVGPAYGPLGGLPIISFQIGTYWDDHYRERSWYDQRNRYDNRYDRRFDRREDWRDNTRHERRFDERIDRRVPRHIDRVERVERVERQRDIERAPLAVEAEPVMPWILEREQRMRDEANSR